MNAGPSRPPGPDPAPFFARLSTIRRKATTSLVSIALLSGLIVMGRAQLAELARAHQVEVTEPDPPSVRLAEVVEEVVSPGVSYSAVVKEFRKAELSFRVGGTIDEILQVAGPGGVMRDVHEGDRIPKGKALARLSPSDYRRDRNMAAERLAAAEARLAKAEADAEFARSEHRRTERLVGRNAGTPSDLDSTRAKVQNTTAAVSVALREIEEARVSLQQADANLEYCTLAAPFEETTIAGRSVDAFERVSANQRAFTVLDLTRVVIGFGVPDSLVGRLSIGQPVSVTAEAVGSEPFEGVIHMIGTVADPQTRSYPVEVRIDRPGGLRPGMVATAHFRKERRAYLLPLTAITLDNPERKPSVYRVGVEDGREVVRQVPATLDDVLDNRIAIRLADSGEPGGLRVGDRVVANGVHRLRDGEAVHVAEGSAVKP
ncbi:MAG: efflux RND transporter periplasmic adaptor subunit [Isosphaeraceae bacterium]